jgi:hypothetical protein
MTTPFTSVFDLFMMSVTDHRLNALFITSETDFATYLEGWLIPAIAEFTTCDQSLVYSNSAFTETLTQKNINILMLLMKKRWLEKEVDNILGMTAFIQDRDYKTHAASQNMREKQARLIQMKEEVSQQLVDYGLGTTDWSAWLNQEFYIP